MQRQILTAVSLILGATIVSMPVLSDKKRDGVIAEYYDHNPRDSDYFRWKSGRHKWSDRDYLRWYQTRTRAFQARPGVASIFGIDETKDKLPGFTVQ
jgi:hypothetical protein